MKGRVVAALVGVFLIGLAIGAVVALAFDDGDSSGDSAPSAAECQEANDVVGASTETIAAIDETTEEQDINYFASVLVELRTAIYVMDDVPECFSIGDRARAAGFIEGVEASMRFLELSPEPTPTSEP